MSGEKQTPCVSEICAKLNKLEYVRNYENRWSERRRGEAHGGKKSERVKRKLLKGE